jgi:hypothetical protein
MLRMIDRLGTLAVVTVCALGMLSFGVNVPLGPTNDAITDQRLQGTWMCAVQDPDEIVHLPTVIIPFNAKEYYLGMTGAGGCKEDGGTSRLKYILNYRMFISNLRGHRFLNMEDLAEKGEYTFYDYKFDEHGELILRQISSRIFPKDLKTERKAGEIVLKEMDQPGFFEENPVRCKRVKVDHRLGEGECAGGGRKAGK